MSTFELLIFIVFIITVIFFSTQWWLKPQRKSERAHPQIEPTEVPDLPPWGDHRERDYGRDYRDQDGEFVVRRELKSATSHSEFPDSQLTSKDLTSMGIGEQEAFFAKEDALMDPLFEPLPPRQEAKPKEAPKAKSKAPDIVIINILPQAGQYFLGYELLQALLAVGFRYGEMSIFHRHEQVNGKGKILFSIAQATEPGIFNLDEVGALSCAGLTLFMRFTGPEHNIKTFDLMIDTAHQLAEDLDARLTDSKRQPLTTEQINQHRQKLEGIK